jgi:hypothetical protein
VVSAVHLDGKPGHRVAPGLLQVPGGDEVVPIPAWLAREVAVAAAAVRLLGLVGGLGFLGL